MTSDIGNVPAVITGGGDGWGGGLGVLLVAMMAMGMGGFGGRGCGSEWSYHDGSLLENGIMDRTDARFNSLENMNEFRSLAQTSEIKHISQLEKMHDMDQDICATKTLILEEGHKNALIEKDTQLQIALGFKDLAAQNAACCCETQRAIAECSDVRHAA